ncbi:MAG: DNA cytosine methyltransferase [Treponema sp.]|nr:DNA cytosine methyltransferase [Treponema sp.]
MIKYLDLFAGAGGLSEGFIHEGFTPVAHIEMSEAACFTLKTRAAFHYLQSQSNLEPYKLYTSGKTSRNEFYSSIPTEILDSVICKEISDETINELFQQIDKRLKKDSIDLIIGGPPCQAYSLVGRARDPNRMENDRRNYLFKYYTRFLEKYKPTFFVFENVMGLLSAKDRNGEKYFDIMRKEFENCGYKLKYEILSANEFGIPQHRKRIILVGKKTNSDFNFPLPEKWNPQITINDVFSDLPSLKSGEGKIYQCTLKKSHTKWLDDAEIRNIDLPVTFHISRPNSKQDLEIYRRAVDLWDKKQKRLSYLDLPQKLQTHKNTKSFLDRFKVVAGDESASQTVVAHIAKDGHYYIHPDITQNRSITPREAARLQTFPDDYYFESISGKPSRTEAYKQIGNAVPVLLAQKIATKLKEIWDE